ncbi:MAG: ABC transporter ATP-binding protein [Spirochaetales bacterium]|nr:ABC transporter ATP-binding protein [Spirochaetales bacterium]
MKNDSTQSHKEAILTAGLTKRFAEVLAVDSLDLRVRPGEIYGFLGRNGAGKTTTIRMLLGLIRPTRGRVELFGKDVGTERASAVAASGSLVESSTFYPSLTVTENLEIQRRLTGSTHSDLKEAVALLGLGDLVRRRAGRLSLGNKQRLALARALLHRPRLLILDEPSNGLDPAGIVEIRKLLRRLADENGVTVFISSHILGEIRQLADRIGIIHRGKLIEELDMRKADIGSTVRWEARVSEPSRAAVLLREKAPGYQITSEGDGALVISSNTHDKAMVDSGLISRVLVGGGFELRALIPEEEDLEKRFLRLTGGES